MGEISEMMLDGTLCAGCGEYLDAPNDGIPTYCSGCRPDYEGSAISARTRRNQRNNERKKRKKALERAKREGLARAAPLLLQALKQSQFALETAYHLTGNADLLPYIKYNTFVLEKSEENNHEKK